MISIRINNDNVEINTTDEQTIGCTEKERKILLGVAKALCAGCMEGAE